jgi:glutathione S-transferase
MGAITLYADSFYFSPYVFSSFVALREKKVEFGVVAVSLPDGAQLQPSYAIPTVTGRVPSIDHDGFRLAESSAIAEYLEEAFPAPAHPRLLPGSMRDRARARQIMGWLRSDLAALRDDRSTATMFYRFPEYPLSEQGQRDVDRLFRVADQLIPASGGPLFGAWTLVDAELSFMIHRLILKGDSVPDRIAAYARAQWARPSVQEFARHPRPKIVAREYWPRGLAQLPD